MRRLLAVIFLALVLAPLAAAAAKQPVFGLRAAGNPKLGYFVYPLAPGAARVGGVIVSNSGTAAGTVKLFTADATTGRTTGTVYLTDQKATHTGAWVELAQKSLFLKPGAHKLVRFTVHVPAATKPGQWVGGIVAETSQRVTGSKSKQKASVQIKIRDLTIVAVQVNVPGPAVNAFKIGGVKTGGQRGFQELVTHVENNGNMLVKPAGTVTVLDSRGATLQTLTFKMDTFLPETAIDYPLLLKKALAPGDYTANIRVSVPAAGGAQARIVTAHPAFSVSKQDVQQVFTSAAPQKPPPGVAAASSSSKTPWAVIAAAAAGVVLLLILLWLLLRRRKTSAQRAPTTVQRSASAAAAATPGPRDPEPEPEPEPEPVSEPTLPPAPEPAHRPPVESLQSSDCDHYWEVAYDRGQLGEDGVWRFPHRCNNCGLELLASDVTDATAQAGVRV
jgi:opacity protein-like surface antigen